MKNSIKVISLFLILSSVQCKLRDARNQDFDYSVLPILKKFQQKVSEKDSLINSNRPYAVFNYQFVYALNFEKHFYFLDDSLKTAMLKILTEKKVLLIEYSSRTCITFTIKALGNSFLRNKWKELYLVFYNGSNDACINHTHGLTVENKNIRKIDTYWYLVLANNERRIGG